MEIWMAEARSRLCDAVVFVPGAPGRGVGEEGFTGKTMVELAYDGTNRSGVRIPLQRISP